MTQGSGWLTIEEAAERVDRSTDTIYRWVRDGHLFRPYTRVSEAQLLEVDVRMRRRIGRPRKLRKSQ